MSQGRGSLIGQAVERTGRRDTPPGARPGDLRGLSDRAHRLAVHRADHPAAAGDQHLPAALDDLSLLHQLPRQPARPPRSSGSAPRNYERILTDEDIWGYLQVTAHFVFWSILLQVLLGFGLALLINRSSRATASGPRSSSCR